MPRPLLSIIVGSLCLLIGTHAPAAPNPNGSARGGPTIIINAMLGNGARIHIQAAGTPMGGIGRMTYGSGVAAMTVTGGQINGTMVRMSGVLRDRFNTQGWQLVGDTSLGIVRVFIASNANMVSGPAQVVVVP